MLVDGEILIDGMGMIRYLDRRLQELAGEHRTATGIIISTAVRAELTVACQKTMNQLNNPSETINRFRNVLLIEDSINEDRLEVVIGTVPPVEGNAFLDLKKAGR